VRQIKFPLSTRFWDFLEEENKNKNLVLLEISFLTLAMDSTRGGLSQCQNKLQSNFGPSIKILDGTHFMAF